MKQQNFWDAIRVTACVAGAAIAQMHRLCRVCVQTGAADRPGMNQKVVSMKAIYHPSCKQSNPRKKKKRRGLRDAALVLPHFMHCQSQPTGVSFLNQTEEKRGGVGCAHKERERKKSPCGSLLRSSKIMTHALRPYIRVCLILVKDIKL